MKKLSVFLSIVVSVMLFFAVATSSVFAVQVSGSNSCEYQFTNYDVNEVCFCLWNGIEGDFCTCPQCTSVEK
jgi:hypothetical protein